MRRPDYGNFVLKTYPLPFNVEFFGLWAALRASRRHRFFSFHEMAATSGTLSEHA